MRYLEEVRLKILIYLSPRKFPFNRLLLKTEILIGSWYTSTYSVEKIRELNNRGRACYLIRAALIWLQLLPARGRV